MRRIGNDREEETGVSQQENLLSTLHLDWVDKEKKKRKNIVGEKAGDFSTTTTTRGRFEITYW